MAKYHNKKVTIDGIEFDSKAEGKRYQELKLLERAGEIEDLKIHPKFRLLHGRDWNGVHYRQVNYYADFKYVDCESGKYIIEDVKGMETAVFRLKLKMLVSRLDESEFEFRIVKG